MGLFAQRWSSGVFDGLVLAAAQSMAARIMYLYFTTSARRLFAMRKGI